MATRITVNGMAFDGVEDMPPHVRRAYEEMLAHLPEFADRDRDGVPDVVEGEPGPVKMTTSVHRKFIVNGVPYDDESAMPTAVRQAYRQAIRAASGTHPTVNSKFEISFQIEGPGFAIGRAPAPRPDDVPSGAIEPSEGRVRWLLFFLGAVAAAGLMLWWVAGRG